MGLTDNNKKAISFKKLVGKAHTQQDFTFSEEALSSSVSMSYQTIFGELIDPLPVTNGGLSALNSTDGIVKRVKFEIDLILDTQIGANQSQGYQLKLPAGGDVTIGGVTYSAGTYLNAGLGNLQIIPPLYGQVVLGTNEYDVTLYQTNGTSEIAKFDSIDWILDYYNGVLFIQSPPAGYDISATRPGYLEAYLYVGDYLKDSIGGGSSIIGIESDVSTLYNLSNSNFSLTDNKLLRMSASSANIVVIPDDATLTTVVSGSSLSITQSGVGQTTISGGTGVTLQTSDGVSKLRTQHSTATIIKVTTNTWLLIGDVTA